MQLLLILLSLLQQPVVPFKPANEFDIKVDMKFKLRRPPNSTNTGTAIDFNGLEKEKTARFDNAPHAYIFLNLNLIKLSEREVRCKVTDAEGSQIYTKKVKPGTEIKLEIGFVDEIKEIRRNSSYDVVLYSPDKTAASHITISIDKDGIYRINGEKSGKF